MTLDDIIYNARKRIDAQLATNNYNGYQDALEDAIYKAYSLAINELTLEIVTVSHRLNQKTKEDDI